MIKYFIELFSKLKHMPSSQIVDTSPIETKPESPPAVEKKQDDKVFVESTLVRLSYSADKNFQAALRQFQSDQGLSVDGILGPKTLARIRFYDEKLKSAPPELKQLRRFRATHYYIAEQKDYPSDKTIPVYTLDKSVLCTINAAFFCNSALEGTGKLKDGRLINVSGKPYVKVDPEVYRPAAEVYEKHVAYMKSKNRTPRPSRYFGVDYVDGRVVAAQAFHFVEKLGKGYGIGKKGIPHEPGKTIATDQGLYATSEPRFKGKGGLWPAGTRGWIIDIAGENGHDGWVTAADVGGGIFGAHLDFFTGTKEFSDDWPLRSNAVTYVWFDGIEDRIPPDYEYGLFDRR